MNTLNIPRGETGFRSHLSITKAAIEAIRKYQDQFEEEHGIRPSVSLATSKLIEQVSKSGMI